MHGGALSAVETWADRGGPIVSRLDSGAKRVRQHQSRPPAPTWLAQGGLESPPFRRVTLAPIIRTGRAPHGAEEIAWGWIGVLAASPGGSVLEVHQETDFLIVKTPGILLRFERAFDRWRHVIEPGEGGAWLMTSVEGAADDPCPSSPAYQDLWFEDRGGGRCEIQLMGQAGGSIYSAAVAVDETAGCVSFDVCARRKRAGVQVTAQSRYHVQPERDGDWGESWLPSRGFDFEATFPRAIVPSMSEPVRQVAGGFEVGYTAQHCNMIAPEISQWRWQYSLTSRKQA